MSTGSVNHTIINSSNDAKLVTRDAVRLLDQVEKLLQTDDATTPVGPKTLVAPYLPVLL